MKTVQLLKKPEYSREKEIITFVYASILLFAVPIYTTFAAEDLGGFFSRLIYFLSNVAIYVFAACFIKRRHLLWVCAPMLLIDLYDFVYVLMYHRTADVLWTYTALVAEGGEMTELLVTYLPLAIVVMFFWSAYFILTYRYAQKEHFFQGRMRRIVTSVSGGWCALMTIFLLVARFTGGMMPFQAVVDVSPIHDFNNLCRIAHIRYTIHDGQKNYDSFRFGATTTAEDDELVVLVLGETGRYLNWQMNGYDRETSPHLMARQDQLITYDSCYTVANLTTVSVPMLMSRATPQNTKIYYNEPSFLQAFQEAGYMTAWIADQSFNNPFLLTFSGRCDFLFYHDHKSFQFYDIDLLQPLNQCISTQPGKQMIVLHSLGCHFKYSARYPKEMSYFRPDLNDVSAKEVFSLRDWDGLTIDRNNIGSSFANVARSILTNSYDNAIRYTDFFLDSVITSLEQTGRPVVMVYVADHGENLLDDEQHKLLHGQESTSIYEFHVPLFVWASQSYKERYPERWAALQSNSHSRISTMNIYHSMLNLGSVEMPLYEPHKSIASPSLLPDSISYRLNGDFHPIPLNVHIPER